MNFHPHNDAPSGSGDGHGNGYPLPYVSPAPAGWGCCFRPIDPAPTTDQGEYPTPNIWTGQPVDYRSYISGAVPYQYPVSAVQSIQSQSQEFWQQFYPRQQQVHDNNAGQYVVQLEPETVRQFNRCCDQFHGRQETRQESESNSSWIDSVLGPFLPHSKPNSNQQQQWPRQQQPVFLEDSQTYRRGNNSFREAYGVSGRMWNDPAVPPDMLNKVDSLHPDISVLDGTEFLLLDSETEVKKYRLVGNSDLIDVTAGMECEDRNSDAGFSLSSGKDGDNADSNVIKGEERADTVEGKQLEKRIAKFVTTKKTSGGNLNTDDDGVNANSTNTPVVASDKLSASIWKLSREDAHLEVGIYRLKLVVWKNLKKVAALLFSKGNVRIVGSTLSGLSTKESDLDIVLLVPEYYPLDKNVCDIHFVSLFNLDIMKGILEYMVDVADIQLINSKVPLLKFTVDAGACGVTINVDVTCNQDASICNTRLLLNYCSVDWRVAVLGKVIKRWARVHKLNDPHQQMPTSYCWSLLLIHFLQAGIQPPMIPVLRKNRQYKKYFEANANIKNYTNVYTVSDMTSPMNTSSLGQVLIEFFKYYASFDFTNNVISIQEGQLIPKENYHKKFPAGFFTTYIGIEEPYTTLNSARLSFSKSSYIRIKTHLQTAFKKLSAGCQLKEIFQPIH